MSVHLNIGPLCFAFPIRFETKTCAFPIIHVATIRNMSDDWRLNVWQRNTVEPQCS
jgi:hypothetical protein